MGRAAFAAACAQRLTPVYRAFAGHALVIEEKERQLRDLEELVALGAPDIAERGRVADRLRLRAEAQALKYLVRP